MNRPTQFTSTFRRTNDKSERYKYKYEAPPHIPPGMRHRFQTIKTKPSPKVSYIRGGASIKSVSIKPVGILMSILIIFLLTLIAYFAKYYLIFVFVAFYYALRYENFKFKHTNTYSGKNVALNSLSGPIFLYRYYNE